MASGTIASTSGLRAERQRIVIVTGPSGAGRSTAVRVLEDVGFEVIDNLPLSLLDRLIAGPPLIRPLALGIDVRNRDFSVDALAEALSGLARRPEMQVELLYLDCRPDVLIRRYSETRRRHPLARAQAPAQGIAREIELLAPIRRMADILIETSEMTPHELRREIERRLGIDAGKRLLVSVLSFSYRRGIPNGADMVFDCRFLRNPYWQESLRGRDGRAQEVVRHVEEDPRLAPFCERVGALVELLLPAFAEEGKAHFAMAFGCTGGQHRSVVLAERFANALAAAGWRVSIRHRELERRSGEALAADAGGEDAGGAEKEGRA